jgi:hypothetical protein
MSHRSTLSVCTGLVVLLLALVTASCGKAGTGIVGIVTESRPIAADIASPTPSPLPDGFGVSSEMAATGPLVLFVERTTGSVAGRVVAKTQTSDGLFKVTVPPGSYVVVIKGANRESDQSSEPLNVRAGRYSRLVLYMTTHA